MSRVTKVALDEDADRTYAFATATEPVTDDALNPSYEAINDDTAPTNTSTAGAGPGYLNIDGSLDL